MEDIYDIISKEKKHRDLVIVQLQKLLNSNDTKLERLVELLDTVVVLLTNSTKNIINEIQEIGQAFVTGEYKGKDIYKKLASQSSTSIISLSNKTIPATYTDKAVPKAINQPISTVPIKLSTQRAQVKPIVQQPLQLDGILKDSNTIKNNFTNIATKVATTSLSAAPLYFIPNASMKVTQNNDDMLQAASRSLTGAISAGIPTNTSTQGGQGGGQGGSTQSNSISPRMNASSKSLDSLSAQFESNNDIATVAFDNRGGTSYGTAQWSTRQGSFSEFIKRAGKSNISAVAGLAKAMNEAGDWDSGKNGKGATAWRNYFSSITPEERKQIEDFEKQQKVDMFVNPQLKRLQERNPELAKRIQSSETLQQVFYSTAIQHNNITPDIIIQAYDYAKSKNDNVTNEAFINAIYDSRVYGGNNQNIDKNKRENIVTRVADDSKRGMVNRFGENGGERKQALANLKAEIERKASRADNVNDLNINLSQIIQQNTEQAVRDKVGYGYRKRSTKLGQIDCSGLQAENSVKFMKAINEHYGYEVFSKKDIHNIQTSAEGIVKMVGSKTGYIRGEDLKPENIKEGTLIGIDTKNGGWGRNDHIVSVFRDDKSGELMVSESTSEKNAGVRTLSYNEFYKTQLRRGNKMTGVMPSRLASLSQSTASNEQTKEEKRDPTIEPFKIDKLQTQI